MAKNIHAIGDNIIIKAQRKEKGIILLDDNKQGQKKWFLENTVAWSLGDKVKKVKKGDTVIVDPRTPAMKIKVNELLGNKEKENEIYLSIKEDNILAIIN